MLKQRQKALDQAFERRHYYRSLRIHKECFDALVQFRIEKVTGRSRSYNVFLKIFRNHQRTTKGLKTTVNRIFALIYFLSLLLKLISASFFFFTVCKNKLLNREDVRV